MSRRLLTGIGQLVTAPPGLRIGRQMNNLVHLPDAALLMGDGRIRWIGPARDVGPTGPDVTRTDLGGRVVSPCWIDSHAALPTHASPLDLRVRLDRALAAGTTTVHLHLELLPTLAATLERVGEISSLVAAHPIDVRLTVSLPNGVADWLDALAVLSPRPGIALTLDAATDRTWLERALDDALRIGLRVVLVTDGTWPIPAGPHLVVGLTRVPERWPEPDTLAVLTPSAGADLGRELVDRYDVPFALGSGAAPGLTEALFAFGRLTPPERLAAATINGAFALNLATETGTLAVGKRADLVAWDACHLADLPTAAPHAVVCQGRLQTPNA